MQLRPDEWKYLFDLRDDLEGEDRAALRRLIKYVEYLERTIKEVKALLTRSKGGGDHE